nr:unnamed protein product [Callosobruchus analis]
MEFSTLPWRHRRKTHRHYSSKWKWLLFYNYKGRHSMVLLAVVDARYQFIMCDFGVNGRISDGGCFKYHILYESVKKSSKILPYVFVADDAFALRIDTMKPFRQADLNSKERRYTTIEYLEQDALLKMHSEFWLLDQNI